MSKGYDIKDLNNELIICELYNKNETDLTNKINQDNKDNNKDLILLNDHEVNDQNKLNCLDKKDI